MKRFSDRDMDNLAAILDYCDRIDSIVERFGNSFELFNADDDYRDAVLMNAGAALYIGGKAESMKGEQIVPAALISSPPKLKMTACSTK